MAILVSQRWSESRLKKEPFNWTATESWDVVGVSDKYAAIEAAIGENTPHPDNPMMMCCSRAAASNKGALAWIVTAQFKFGSFIDNDSPLLLPPKITWEPTSLSVPIDRDLNNNFIVNSAGSVPSSNSTTKLNNITLVCTQAEPFFAVSKPLQYGNTTNTNSFSVTGAGGVSAGQAYCEYIRPTQEYTNDAPFVLVQYRISFRDGTDPWQLKMPDVGREGWYNDSTGTPQPGLICYSDGTPVTADVRLDGTGKPILSKFKILGEGGSINTPIANPNVPTYLTIDSSSTADIKYLKYVNVTQTDWSGIGINDFGG